MERVFNAVSGAVVDSAIDSGSSIALNAIMGGVAREQGLMGSNSSSLNAPLIMADDVGRNARKEGRNALSEAHDPRNEDPPLECEACTMCGGRCSRCRFTCRCLSVSAWALVASLLGWWGVITYFVLTGGWAVLGVAPLLFGTAAVWIYAVWYCAPSRRRAANFKMLWFVFCVGALPGVGFAILAELALQSSFMLFVPAGVRATTLGAALYYFFNAFFVAAGVEELTKVWAMRCQKAICSSSCCFRLCNWNSDPNAKCCGRAAARFFCAARFTPGRARDGCCLGTSLRQPRAFVIYTMVAAMGFSTTENFEVRVTLRVCV